MSSIQSSFTNLELAASFDDSEWLPLDGFTEAWLAKFYEVDEDLLTRAIDKISAKEVILFSMSGKMASGKDTIGDLISSNLKDNGCNLISTSFGLLIREEVTELVNGYNETINKKALARYNKVEIEDLDYLSSLLENTTAFDRTPEARTALQFWGTDVRRKQHDTYWINKMAQFIVSSINKGYSVNVTDARFPNEAKLIEDLAGKVIRLDVSERVRIRRIEMRDDMEVNLDSLRHTSESALDDYSFPQTFDGEKPVEMLVKEGLDYIME